MKHIITIPRKKLPLRKICALEKKRLASNNFDWKKELHREVRESERVSAIMGREDNDAVKAARVRLKRLDKKERRHDTED